MIAAGFLLDEHVPKMLRELVAAAEPTALVLVVGDSIAPPKSTPDPDLLLWIEMHDCLLVTNNRASMPGHLAAHLARGGHVPGIIQLPRRAGFSAILNDLLTLLLAARPEEIHDQIVYLPLRR